MRRFLPFIFLALFGCTTEPPPPPASEAVGIPKQGGAPIPLGEVMTPQELATKADIPLYPGAETPEKQSNIRRDDREVRYEIVMLTPDAPDEVQDFYKKAWPKGQDVSGQWMGMTPKGNFASVKTEPSDGKTKVTVVVRATEAEATTK